MTIRTDKSYTIWAPEAAYGVIPQTGWQHLGIFDSVITPDPTYGWVPYFSIAKPRRETIMKGKQSFKGSIPNIRVTNPQPMIYLPFSINNHIQVNDLSPIPSFSLATTMFDTDGNIALGRTWYGGKINRASIVAKEGEDLKFNIEEMIFKGMSNTRSTNVKYSSSYTPDAPIAEYGRYLFSGATVIAFGLIIGKVKSFQLDINNNIQEWYGITDTGDPEANYSPLRLLSGKQEYKLTLELDLTDAATDLQFWDYMINQGGAPVLGTNILATFAGDFTLSILCSFAQTTINPGTVITDMNIPMDVTKGGYYSAIVNADVDSVRIAIQ